MERTQFADFDRNPAEMVTRLIAVLAEMARHREIRWGVNA